MKLFLACEEAGRVRNEHGEKLEKTRSRTARRELQDAGAERGAELVRGVRGAARV